MTDQTTEEVKVAETPIVEEIQVPQEVKVEEIPVEEVPSPTPEPEKVEEAVVVEKVNEKPVLMFDDKEVFTIRANETGDKVYLVCGEKRYWVKNLETLIKLGSHLGQEKTVPFSELLQYPEGEPLDLTIPGVVYPWNKPEVPKSNEPTSPHKIWAV